MWDLKCRMADVKRTTLLAYVRHPTSDIPHRMTDWLGPDSDGVIAFDKAHLMKNAAADATH
jgi:hypothetical protein